MSDEAVAIWGVKIELLLCPSSFPSCSRCYCRCLSVLLSLACFRNVPSFSVSCPSPAHNMPCILIIIIIIIIILHNAHRDRRSEQAMPASHTRPRRRPLLLLLRPSLLLLLLLFLTISSSSSVLCGSSSSTTSLLPPPPSSYSFSPASLPPPSSCPGTLKTGTTIAGVVCGDAVVLAADTRYV